MSVTVCNNDKSYLYLLIWIFVNRMSWIRTVVGWKLMLGMRVEVVNKYPRPLNDLEVLIVMLGEFM